MSYILRDKILVLYLQQNVCVCVFHQRTHSRQPEGLVGAFTIRKSSKKHILQIPDQLILPWSLVDNRSWIFIMWPKFDTFADHLRNSEYSQPNKENCWICDQYKGQLQVQKNANVEHFTESRLFLKCIRRGWCPWHRQEDRQKGHVSSSYKQCQTG